MASLHYLTSWAALAASTALLLSGCGNNYPDTAQVTPANSQLASMVDNNRQMELFYLTDQSVQGAQRLADLRTDVKAYIRNDASTGYQDQIDFSSAADSQDIEKLKKALAAYDAHAQESDGAWKEKLEEKLAPIQSELETAKAALTKVTDKRDGYRDVIQPAQTEIESIQKKIDEKEKRMDHLVKQVAERWNQYILDNDMAIRTLDDDSSKVFSYLYIEQEECQKNRYDDKITVDRTDQDGRCYYLKLPDKSMKNSEITEGYAETFKKHMKLQEEIGDRYNPEDGSLKVRLSRARGKLDDAEIRAENRYGSEWDLKRQYKRAARKVENLEKDIENIQSPASKERFLDDYMEYARVVVETVLDEHVSRRVREIFSSTTRQEVSLSNDFKLEEEAKILALVIPTSSFRHGSGQLVTTVDMTQPVETDRLNITPNENNSTHSTEHDPDLQVIIAVASAMPASDS
ncbi:hypothetical protein QWY79_00115 [Halomonas sabkhae]|uniref:hypothetical protein n=1 Tax=Halomonas sabkhae TaxID=626223 RepID=UPI0025B59635|nr:hypothetical protein [Halomonas sabkhae]MDN3523667.1 hypothetical protein [Halomonas sabkhae]